MIMVMMIPSSEIKETITVAAAAAAAVVLAHL